VLVRPSFTVIYGHVLDQFRVVVAYGNGEPLCARSGLDAIPILPFVFLVLYRIEENKNIGAIDLIEVTQPWEVLRLMNGADHLSHLAKVTKMGLLMSRPIFPRTSNR